MAAQEGRAPYPPFTAETAQIKVKAAQDGWNTRFVYPVLFFSSSWLYLLRVIETQTALKWRTLQIPSGVTVTRF